MFCSRCGLNFTVEFKGTPLADVKEVSPTLMRLRENLAGRLVGSVLLLAGHLEARGLQLRLRRVELLADDVGHLGLLLGLLADLDDGLAHL